MTGRQRSTRESGKLKRSKRGPATGKERRRAEIRGTTVTAMRKKRTDRKAAKQAARAKASRKRSSSRRSSSSSSAPRTTSSSSYSRWTSRYSK